VGIPCGHMANVINSGSGRPEARLYQRRLEAPEYAAALESSTVGELAESYDVLRSDAMRRPRPPN